MLPNLSSLTILIWPIALNCAGLNRDLDGKAELWVPAGGPGE
jgi:hypothetical protein